MTIVAVMAAIMQMTVLIVSVPMGRGVSVSTDIVVAPQVPIPLTMMSTAIPTTMPALRTNPPIT